MNYETQLYCFRRFTSSFKKLRVDHRQIQCSKNPELLTVFEEKQFSWPIKEPDRPLPQDLAPGQPRDLASEEPRDLAPRQPSASVLDQDGQAEQGNRPCVTQTGRCTGKNTILN